MATGSIIHSDCWKAYNGLGDQFVYKTVNHSKTFKDPLSRQVTEAVLIKNHRGQLLNSKAEFHQPSIVRIQSEIIRGLQD